MMKVAIIAPTLSGRGGEETVISEVLRSKKIKTVDIQIHLLILGKSYNKEWLHGLHKVVNITNTENELKNFIFLQKIIRKENFEKVICLSRKSIFYSYIIRKIIKRSYIIYSWLHFDLNNVKTKFIKLADYHLAISDEICNQLLEKKIGNPSNIFTIYNPIMPHDEIIKRKFTNEFIYVGRITFEGQKDIKELIDNVADLNFKNWTLKIIGDGDDKEKCQKYLLNRYPTLKNNISWEGWKKDPWDNVKTADVLILTSAYEGLAMVLLEAISRGLPCLSSRVSGSISVIQSSINGELYQKGNKKDFSSKLRKILKENYNSNLVKNSINKFYIDKYLDKLIGVLKSERI